MVPLPRSLVKFQVMQFRLALGKQAKPEDSRYRVPACRLSCIMHRSPGFFVVKEMLFEYPVRRMTHIGLASEFKLQYRKLYKSFYIVSINLLKEV